LIDVASIVVTRAIALRDALSILDRSGAGLLLVVNAEGRFERTVSDGDLRRLLLRGVQLGDSLEALPTIASVVAREGLSRRDALALMNRHAINHLPALDADGRVTAVLERRELDQQILLSTPHMGDAEREFIEDAFRTNWIAPLGPNVDSFERELAESVGIRHAAALSSGTAAIHLALVLLGVGRGDRVFCSSLTFAASAFPILYQGAEPVFVDSDRASWNMSPRALERALEESRREGKLPKAIVVVNLYGQSADMDPILALCEHYGVPMVEDAAESLGAQYKGKASGTFGRLGIYSFNGNKIITTSGGGMLVSNEQELIERARILSTQARDPAPHYQHSVVGYNYRMSNILAGVGRGQLRVLDQRVQARRAVFERYRTALADIDAIEWMPEPSWSASTHWLTACTLRSERREVSRTELIRRLAEEMIEARPVWKPLHLQPVFAGCRYFSDGDESVSERLFRDGLCLPSGSNMSDDQLERTIQCIRSVFR
jgi:dTDP-4-amino-4,6-dideoxygalactose transaminase